MSHPVRTALFLLPTALFAAGDPDPGAPAGEALETRRTIPAIDLLPPGSVLEGLMVPSYDENRRLRSLVRSEVVTLVDADRVEGREILIEIHGRPREGREATPGIRLELDVALIDQRLGLIEALEPVRLVSDRVSGHGAGLFYDLRQRRGYLIGPGTITIQSPPRLMKTNRSTASAPAATAAATAIALLAQAPGQIQPDPEAEAALRADAASRAAEFDARRVREREDFARDLEDSSRVSAEISAFLNRAAGAQRQTPPATETPQRPPSEALDIAPDPEVSMEIDYKNGSYFDPEQNMVVLFGEVRVNHPELRLSGADELKIFFVAPEEPAAEEADESEESEAAEESADSGFNFDFDGFGEIERIIATGAIDLVLLADENQEGAEDIRAHGAIFSYHIAEESITISGGHPWIRRGERTYLRSALRDQSAHIDLKNRSFTTEGDWRMGAPAESLRPDR